MWRPIAGYWGRFEVSSFGRVRDTVKKMMRKTSEKRDGDYLCCLHVPLAAGCKGKRTQKKVHRLVLEAFVGPCPKGMEACHNDSNPANNRLDNLRWDTHKSNIADKLARGTNRGPCKLSDDDIRAIRKMALRISPRRPGPHGCAIKKVSLRTIGLKFGLGQSGIHNIIYRKTYNWVK